MSLALLFPMGLAMTSPPIAASATVLSFGTYGLRPRFPIDTAYRAPSVSTNVQDPQVAHYAEARDPQRRRPRVFTLRHEEDRAGWIEALSLWEVSGYGTRALDWTIPDSSPTESIQVLLLERPSLATDQSSSEVYTFTVQLEELLHPIPS